jgi:hypothetical protein
MPYYKVFKNGQRLDTYILTKKTAIAFPSLWKKVNPKGFDMSLEYMTPKQFEQEQTTKYGSDWRRQIGMTYKPTRMERTR